MVCDNTERGLWWMHTNQSQNQVPTRSIAIDLTMQSRNNLDFAGFLKWLRNGAYLKHNIVSSMII